MTISQCNRQSPGRARRGTLSQPSYSSLQVSNEHNPMGMFRLGHTQVSETDKIIAMNTCGTTSRKMGVRQIVETDQVQCKVI